MVLPLYSETNYNYKYALLVVSISLLVGASGELPGAIQAQPNSAPVPPPQPVGLPAAVSAQSGNLTKLLAPNNAKPATALTPTTTTTIAQPTAAVLPVIQSAGLLTQTAPLLPSLAAAVLKTLPLNTTALQQQVQSIPRQPIASIIKDQSINQLQQQQVQQLVQPQQPEPLPADSARPIGQEDPIVQLDYATIGDNILHKPTVNIVYFNANFNSCRHCHRFYANWKDLALDIRWWRPVIKLFTINCSDEDNIDVCRRAGVTQFPQVKFYWTMSNSLDQDGQRLRVLGKSVHAIRHLITNKVLESYMEHNKLLAKRTQQRSPGSSALNPFAALLSTITGGGGGSGSSSPLSALMPVVGQLLGGGLGGKKQTPTGGGGGSVLSSVIGLLTGSGGGKQPAEGAAPESGLSIVNLMNSFGGLQGLNKVIDALMSLVSWKRSLTIQPLAQNWPKLDQIDETDSQRLLAILSRDPARRPGALLIMETQEFLYLGLEVMLDLIPYSNQTYMVRVRDERSQLSKNLTKRDDIRAPALIYVTESRAIRLIATAPKYTNDEDLRRTFVRAFERRQVKYPVKRIWSPSLSGGGGSNNLAAPFRNDSSEDEEILNRLNDVHMNDLLNTIRVSLMEQVFIHPDLSDDQYNALVRYVYALINYFPFENDDQLKFFKRLHAWLQNQVSPVDIAEYKKQFHDFDEVIGKHDWVACKSLSSIDAIQAKSRTKSGLLFDNPSQLGKMVSNITRLFRTNKQKIGELKNLIGMFTSGSSTPVMLSNPAASSNNPTASTSTSTSTKQRDKQKTLATYQLSTTSTTSAPTSSDTKSSSSTSAGEYNDKRQSQMVSSVEKLIKSFTNGSLGSDMSILKLISTALTGGDASSTSKRAKSKFAREYPCGAWKLAHVMVVNEYIRDSPRKDVKHIVMHSLYQYMLHFYACSTCGNRVSDIRGEFRLNLDEHLNDQADSIMLLWKVHNRVNKRLESEIRPGSPTKQQFPSESLCSKCRGSSQQQNDLVFTPNWHEKQVLNFLVHHYRPQSIIVSTDTTTASTSGDSSSSSSKSSSSSSSSLLSSLTSSTRPPRHQTKNANSAIASPFMLIKQCAKIVIGLGTAKDEPDYLRAYFRTILSTWPPPPSVWMPILFTAHSLFCWYHNVVQLFQTTPLS